MPQDQQNDHSHGQALPADCADLEIGTILWDRRRTTCFEVRGIDDDGIGLRQADREYYVPQSLLAPWYGSRLVPLAATTSIDPPEWC